MTRPTSIQANQLPPAPGIGQPQQANPQQPPQGQLEKLSYASMDKGDQNLEIVKDATYAQVDELFAEYLQERKGILSIIAEHQEKWGRFFGYLKTGFDNIEADKANLQNRN